MVRRIPIHNAVKNEPEILEGELVDEIREPSVFVDGNGKSYDASRGLKVGDLPNGQLTQLPRTTWYEETDEVPQPTPEEEVPTQDEQPFLPFPTDWYSFKPERFDEDVVIVGWFYGSEGCVPMYARRSDVKNVGTRSDALRSAAPDKPRRNWRARKAARQSGSLELPDSVGGGSGSAQP